jgi:hypothetical protein
MIGFTPRMKSITIHERSVNISAVLTESITTLRTVNITAISNSDREKYMALFIKNFIGETVNAQQCELLNPRVLNFSFDKETNMLQASADELLIVENKALGYKLKYLLNEFEYDMKTDICTTGGAPYFEELTGTPNQQKRWEENRRLAYLSSDRHFYRAIMNNTTREEGFLIFKVPDTTGFNNKKKQNRFQLLTTAAPVKKKNSITVYPVWGDTLFTKAAGGFKELLSKPKISASDTTWVGLLIFYMREEEPSLFNKTGVPIKFFTTPPTPDFPKRQISRIYPLVDTIMIDQNGGLTPAMGFRYFGYWAWQRIADLTPLDYFVEPILYPEAAKSVKK